MRNGMACVGVALLVVGSHTAWGEDAKPPKKPNKPGKQSAVKTDKAANPNQTATVSDGPSFGNRVQPLLGKFGCNGRACHGSFQGQGGFRLSLFGSDPAADRAALRERMNVERPQESLILLKPMRQVDHGGGLRFERGSWPEDLLRTWIAAGAPFDSDEPTVARLEVLPARVELSERGERESLRVVAHYSSGQSEDVTRLTSFTSNDGVIASINESGQVTAGDAGDTAIIAVFGGAIGSTQVLVPRPASQRRAFTFPANNRIDEFVAARWRLLGLAPSERCDDAEFLRRVSLDLIGTLPSAAEVRTFLANDDERKREKLIDTLLDRPEYAVYWATKFSDLTGNDSSRTPPPAARTSWLWHDWLREKLHTNVPYDELVAGFITATTREGRPINQVAAEHRQVAQDITPSAETTSKRPSAASDREGFASPTYAKRRTNDLFWRTYDNPEQAALRIAYAFLGVRLECAQCHKHPFDRWTQQDFRGFTALFARVTRGVPDDVPEDLVVPRGEDERTRELIYRYDEIFLGAKRDTSQKQKGVFDPNAKLPLTPRVLGGSDLTLPAGEDPRQHLMAWLRRADNPFLAPSLVNRLWDHYFGVALFVPTDELSAANPPSHPELLDWLARDFIAHGFDLKRLHRTLVTSRVYQLSWRPHESNASDQRNVTHARLRRLPAEVLIDALDQVTGGQQEAAVWQAKTYSLTIAPAGTRAVALAPSRLGQSPGRYALEVFGRPTRSERCDAERNREVTLSQALYLLYDDDVQRKIAAPDGHLAKLLANTRDNNAVLEELYLTAIGRTPTAAETKLAHDHLASAANRQTGFEDILWSIINLREFTFNH